MSSEEALAGVRRSGLDLERRSDVIPFGPEYFEHRRRIWLHHAAIWRMLGSSDRVWPGPAASGYSECIDTAARWARRISEGVDRD